MSLPEKSRQELEQMSRQEIVRLLRGSGVSIPSFLTTKSSLIKYYLETVEYEKIHMEEWERREALRRIFEQERKEEFEREEALQRFLDREREEEYEQLQRQLQEEEGEPMVIERSSLPDDSPRRREEDVETRTSEQEVEFTSVDPERRKEIQRAPRRRIGLLLCPKDINRLRRYEPMADSWFTATSLEQIPRQQYDVILDDGCSEGIDYSDFLTPNGIVVLPDMVERISLLVYQQYRNLPSADPLTLYYAYRAGVLEAQEQVQRMAVDIGNLIGLSLSGVTPDGGAVYTLA